MSSPKITIITPVHNSGLVLRETLDSVVAQTLPDIEYIVVDDGSTDESPEILDEYAAKYPWIKGVRIPASGSGARPRNVALDQHATGEYVFFLDADDVLAPNAARRMVEVAEETGSDIVLCRMENFGDGTRSIPRAVFKEERRAVDFVESFAYRTLGPWKLFRRRLLEDHGIRFPEEYRVGEDQPFTLKAYLRANHISAIRDEVYYWIRNFAVDGPIVNTSRGGQPIEHDLQKNLLPIQILLEEGLRSERRDILLERFVVSAGGLRSVFDRRFLELSRNEQERLYSRARSLASPAWSRTLQMIADDRTRVLLNELFSSTGNLNELIAIIERSQLNAWTIGIHQTGRRETTIYVQGRGGMLRVEDADCVWEVPTFRLSGDTHRAVIPQRLSRQGLTVWFV